MTTSRLHSAESSEDAFARLSEAGWAQFPALDRPLIAQLSALVAEFAAISRDGETGGGATNDAERGLRAIWRLRDPDLRQRLARALADALRPWCTRVFPDHRLVSASATIKLAGIAHEALPFHRDHAFLGDQPVGGPPRR